MSSGLAGQIGFKDPGKASTNGFLYLAIGWAEGLPGQRYTDDDRLGIVDLIGSLLAGARTMKEAADYAGFQERRAVDLLAAFVRGPVQEAIRRRFVNPDDIVPFAEAVERCGGVRFMGERGVIGVDGG